MSEPWSDVPSAGYWEGQFLMAEERIRTLEAALEKWKNADLYTGDEYRTLEAAVERLREELALVSEQCDGLAQVADAAQAHVRELETEIPGAGAGPGEWRAYRRAKEGK